MASGQELFGTRFEPGDVVFAQGDPGDFMYVVQSGDIEIRHASGDEETVLARLSEGDVFGELALIDPQPRSATAVALTQARLLPLDRDTLAARVSRDPSVALHLVAVLCDRIGATTDRLVALGGADRVPYAATAPPVETHIGEIATLDGSFLGAYGSLEYAAGETIVRQGEPSDTLYIVCAGAVDIVREDAGGRRLVARRSGHEVIGETALLEGGVRSASVLAATDVRLVPIGRDDFLARIRTQPELATYVLQVLVARLHQTLAALHDPESAFAVPPRVLPAGLVSRAKVRVALVALASCAGCTVSLLDDGEALGWIGEHAEIAYCPLLVDVAEIPDVDVAIVEGAVRTREDEEMLREVRERAGTLVAWGTCATHGGIPALANSHDLEDLIAESYGLAADTFAYYLSGASGVREHTYQAHLLTLLRKAGRLHDVVRVDRYVPGCPPPVSALLGILDEVAGGTAAEPAAAGMVCRDCPRKPTKDAPESFSLTPPVDTPPDLCLTSAGVPCMGFLTRGGCGAPCPAAGLPCWGCRGASSGTLSKLDDGDSFEQVMRSMFARRCKTDESAVGPMLRALNRRATGMLGLDQTFMNDEARVR